MNFKLTLEIQQPEGGPRGRLKSQTVTGAPSAPSHESESPQCPGLRARSDGPSGITGAVATIAAGPGMPGRLFKDSMIPTSYESKTDVFENFRVPARIKCRS